MDHLWNADSTLLRQMLLKLVHALPGSLHVACTWLDTQV